MRLYGCGYSTREVEAITGVERRLLLRWYAKYGRGGPTGLYDRGKGGNHRVLTAEQLADVRAKLHQYRPVDVLNLQTGQETVTQAETMNSLSASPHLEALLHRYPSQPLLLLWDHAPWHNRPSIRAILKANPRLEILCFPPATPELNPQKHVWKPTRQAVSHNHDQRRLPYLAERFAPT